MVGALVFGMVAGARGGAASSYMRDFVEKLRHEASMFRRFVFPIHKICRTKCKIHIEKQKRQISM
jgi:hypothetical protein